jgi:hypothetical protein
MLRFLGKPSILILFKCDVCPSKIDKILHAGFHGNKCTLSQVKNNFDVIQADSRFINNLQPSGFQYTKSKLTL